MKVFQEEWDNLVIRTDDDRLVPFLGAGASAGVLPTGGDLVEYLIKKEGGNYPKTEDRDLARVARFFEVMNYGRHYEKLNVREEVARMLKERRGESLNSLPYKDLAQLPISLFLTTNYDDFMEQELRSAGKDPLSFYPMWHPELDRATEHILGKNQDEEITPTVSRPIVYHLHGHWDVPESMVITDDDYIHYLAAIQNPNLLPAMFEKAFEYKYIVFMGYSLRDWNIRVMFLKKYWNTKFYAVMPRPEHPTLASFIKNDLGDQNVNVLWSTAQEFSHELLQRWKSF